MNVSGKYCTSPASLTRIELLECACNIHVHLEAEEIIIPLNQSAPLPDGFPVVLQNTVKSYVFFLFQCSQINDYDEDPLFFWLSEL